MPVPHRIRDIDELQEHFRRYGVLDQGYVPSFLNCSQDDEGKALINLVETLFQAKVMSPAPPAEASQYPVIVPVSSFVPLSDMHSRAIAKIGFHFFLSCFCPPFTGHESQFDGIKRFIYEGGNPRPFMYSGIAPIDRDPSEFPTWAHVLAAGWCGTRNDELGATVQLFAGSNSGIRLLAGTEDGRVLGGNIADTALVWCIRIGSTHLSYNLREARAFVGYEQPEKKFDGFVRKLIPNSGILELVPGSVPPAFWMNR